MDVELAAHNTICMWKRNCRELSSWPKPARSEDGWGLPHALYMLMEVIENHNRWKNDKLNRWLGYAQAILVATRILSLEEVKRANKEA